MDMDVTSTTTCNSSMLWNWYTIDTCFLAESWHVSNAGTFAASCIGVILLVIILESLRRIGKEYDDWILRGFQARIAVLASESGSKSSGPNKSNSPKTIEEGTRGQTGQVVTFRASALQQLVRALIHAVTLGLAYIVMLLAMSYNGYIIICIIIGGGLGKFFCDWMTRRVVIGADTGLGDGAEGIEETTVCCG